MKVRVRVPAQTANLGPGFDCLGLALQLYNELEVRLTPGVFDSICDMGGHRIGGSLIKDAVAAAWDRRSRTLPGVTIRSLNRIPPARGLGSSAAATVAGLIAGTLLLSQEIDRRELLEMAYEFEGHADNAAAALSGGLVAVIDGPRGPDCHQLPCRQDWQVVVGIPELRLATTAARKALPAMVSLADAVHNLGRVALLVTALGGGDPDMLSVCDDDRLHQPIRIPLAAGVEQAIAAGKKAGAPFAAVSGSGPSVIAITKSGADRIGRAFTAGFAAAGIASRYLITKPEPHGAMWWVTSTQESMVGGASQ